MNDLEAWFREQAKKKEDYENEVLAFFIDGLVFMTFLIGLALVMFINFY